MKVASEVVLPVPVERAWGLLMRWEDQPRWMKDADSVRVLGEQREGVGTTIDVTTRVLNVPLFTERLEVTIWEPPRRLVMAHLSFVAGVGTWRLQPVEGGTGSAGPRTSASRSRGSVSSRSVPTGRSWPTSCVERSPRGLRAFVQRLHARPR